MESLVPPYCPSDLSGCRARFRLRKTVLQAKVLGAVSGSEMAACRENRLWIECNRNHTLTVARGHHT